MRPYDYLTERQYSWARRHGITIDEAGYTEELNDNLFLPPTPEVLQELPRDRHGDPHDSVFAAHSSAALVVNVFFYWRLYNNLAPIISAICPNLANYDVEGLVFEDRCPIEWPMAPRKPRTPPQLDVVIRYHHRDNPGVTKAIAIESKFCEPYGGHNEEFADCYLAPENAELWTGIEPLRELAVRIRTGEALYRRLKADQLIKHVLGLNSRFQGPENYQLIYLWYAAPGREAVEHEDEIQHFQQTIRECRSRINFTSMQYQDLINQLARNCGGTNGAYIEYLEERYF